MTSQNILEWASDKGLRAIASLGISHDIQTRKTNLSDEVEGHTCEESLGMHETLPHGKEGGGSVPSL